MLEGRLKNLSHGLICSLWGWLYELILSYLYALSSLYYILFVYVCMPQAWLKKLVSLSYLFALRMASGAYLIVVFVCLEELLSYSLRLVCMPQAWLKNFSHCFLCSSWGWLQEFIFLSYLCALRIDSGARIIFSFNYLGTHCSDCKSCDKLETFWNKLCTFYMFNSLICMIYCSIAWLEVFMLFYRVH